MTNTITVRFVNSGSGIGQSRAAAPNPRPPREPWRAGEVRELPLDEACHALLFGAAVIPEQNPQ